MALHRLVVASPTVLGLTALTLPVRAHGGGRRSVSALRPCFCNIRHEQVKDRAVAPATLYKKAKRAGLKADDV